MATCCISDEEDFVSRENTQRYQVTTASCTDDDKQNFVAAFAEKLIVTNEISVNGAVENSSTVAASSSKLGGKAKSNHNFLLPGQRKLEAVNSGNNFSKVKPRIKVNRKKAGEAAIKAWRKEELHFEKAEKQNEKFANNGPRNILSSAASQAMANAVNRETQKPKIKKKKKPEITEKMLIVLQAVGEGKLNHLFSENEVSRIAALQDERNILMKKLAEKPELSWWRTVFQRWYKRDYYKKEIKNIKMLQSKVDDLDFLLGHLHSIQTQQQLNSIADSLEKLNESYNKELSFVEKDDALEKFDYAEENEKRASAILQLIMRCGSSDAINNESSRPISVLSGAGPKISDDSDAYSADEAEKEANLPEESKTAKEDSSILSDSDEEISTKKKKSPKSKSKKKLLKLKKEKRKRRKASKSNNEESSSENSDSESSTESSSEENTNNEEEFNHASCLPTAEGEEYSNTAYTNLDAFEYRKIFEYASKNDKYFGIHPALHPHGGFLAVFDLAKVRKEKDLSLQDARKEIGTDGFTWALNDGRAQLQRAKNTGVFRTQWRGGDEKRKPIEFKKWLVDCVDYPNIFIIHYFGDHKLCAKGAVHGNSKFSQKPYFSVLPSTRRAAVQRSKHMKPKKVYSISQYETSDGPAAISRLRNLNQAQYAAKVQKLQSKCTPNALFNAMLLSQYCTYTTTKEDDKYFVVDGNFFGPSFRVEMHVSNMIKELHNAAKVTKETQVLFYDTTFLCGDFSISFLSWIHPFFKKVVLLGALIHLTKEAPNHKKFMETFYEKHEKSLKKHRFLFITDEEFSFNRIWPNSTHLYCSLHLMRNMEKALMNAGVAIEQRKKLGTNFRQLRDSPTHQVFDNLKQQYDQANDYGSDEEKKIFDEYIAKLRNNSSLAAYLANKSLDINAVYDLEETVTDNPAESLNALFKAHIEKREMDIDEIIYSIFYFAGVFYNDVVRGYYDDGNFELEKQYLTQKKGSAFDVKQSKLMSLPEFSEFNKWILEQEGPIFEGEQNLEVRKALLVTALDGFKIFKLEENIYTIIDSKTNGKATVTLGKTVRQDECTCRRKATCLHILAAKKAKGDELIANSNVGDPMKDEKRQRNKKVGRHGRKNRQRKEQQSRISEESDSATPSPPTTKGTKRREAEKSTLSESPKSVILSPKQKAAKKENTEQHNREIRSIRAYIKQRVEEFYSLYHRPLNVVAIPDECQTWFSDINNGLTTVSSSIFKCNFIEPLPVLRVNTSCFGTTSDDALFLVTRLEENVITVFAVGNAFSNNCVDEIFLHSTMVARDQNNEISLSLSLYEGCVDLKTKLVILSLFNFIIHHGSSVPQQIDNLVIPAVIDQNFIHTLARQKGAKLRVRRKKTKLLCCCNRPSLLSDERNTAIMNDTMVECNGCHQWRFFKCGAVATTSNDDWYCWECSNGLPPMVDHCNLHSCKFENTCPIDSVLSACYIFNMDHDNVISNVIDKYDVKNVFEDALQVFIASDLNTQKSMEEAKHIFLKKVFKKQTNLEGFEETIVLQHFKDRYLATGDYTCPECSKVDSTVADDYLFFNSIIGTVESTITEALQPEHFDMRVMCCDKFLEIVDKKYNAQIPWVLPLRILQFPFLREFTPEKFEQIPLEVDVFNNNEVIGYKLGLISFAKPGHFAALIPSKNGWIVYDSLKDPVLLPLRHAIRKITEENGTLNCLYYFAHKLPKIKKSQTTKSR